jgi:N-acetylglucosaminyldiphosphoundecaprenol N-acetyl-beta-D-mannosaminyltransferase
MQAIRLHSEELPANVSSYYRAITSTFVKERAMKLDTPPAIEDFVGKGGIGDSEAWERGQTARPNAGEPPALPGSYRFTIKVIEVLGVAIAPLSLRQILAIIQHTVAHRQRLLITYVNAHALNVASTTPWFRMFLNQCDIVFCDGFGVKWGARLLGYHIPQRFTPPDWIDRLAHMASQHGFSLFLVGSRPGIAAKTANLLQARYPDLRIVGTHHGYFDKTPDSQENTAVVQAINASSPDILIVGLGTLLQEQWLKENWQHIDARVALTVGAAFDYVSGEVVRGPKWMTDHGLEWLSRLVIEPRRLWRRYVVGNPLFLWRIFKQRVKR